MRKKKRGAIIRRSGRVKKLINLVLVIHGRDSGGCVPAVEQCQSTKPPALQSTVMHCNPLQSTVMHCNPLQSTVMRYSSIMKMHCNQLSSTLIRSTPWQSNAFYCDAKKSQSSAQCSRCQLGCSGSQNFPCISGSCYRSILFEITV